MSKRLLIDKLIEITSGTSITILGSTTIPTLTSSSITIPSATNLNIGETNLNTTLSLKAPLASPTFTGNVVLPLTTTYNGTTLENIYNNQTPITITGCTLSDSWIVTTDNTSGSIQVFASGAYDISANSSSPVQSPIFTSANTIVTNANWPSNGWVVSAKNTFTNASVSVINAFDGENSNGTGLWSSITGEFNPTSGNKVASSTGTWIQMQYPTAQTMARFTIASNRSANGTYTVNATNDSGGCAPATWELQGSNDNSVFTTVQTYSNHTWTSGIAITYDVTTSHIAYKWWRINFTKIAPSDENAVTPRSNVGITELKFFTGAFVSRLTLSSVYAINTSQFKIVLVDSLGVPASMSTTTFLWDFNLLFTKGGKYLDSGLYRFSRSGTSGVVTKLS